MFTWSDGVTQQMQVLTLQHRAAAQMTMPNSTTPSTSEGDCNYGHFCVIAIQLVIVVIVVPIIITAIHCNGDAIADDYNSTKYS